MPNGVIRFRMLRDEPHIDLYDLPCPRLPRAFDGLSILHLTDLHITGWNRRLGAWAEVLSGIEPDLLAVTGDLGHRSWRWQHSLPNILRLLNAARPRLGTYFILGNHDAAKLGVAVEEQSNCRLLENEAVLLPLPGSAGDATVTDESGRRFAIIGVNQHRRIDTDIPMAMRGIRPDDFKLMLLHYPDLIHQAAAAGADVCLAGHTHGGQICWPDGKPIIRHDALPQAMCTGVHKINGTWMVVNRGLGVAGLRMRLFCPPQAILITLRAVSAPAA